MPGFDQLVSASQRPDVPRDERIDLNAEVLNQATLGTMRQFGQLVPPLRNVRIGASSPSAPPVSVNRTIPAG